MCCCSRAAACTAVALRLSRSVVTGLSSDAVTAFTARTGLSSAAQAPPSRALKRRRAAKNVVMSDSRRASAVQRLGALRKLRTVSVVLHYAATIVDAKTNARDVSSEFLAESRRAHADKWFRCHEICQRGGYGTRNFLFGNGKGCRDCWRAAINQSGYICYLP